MATSNFKVFAESVTDANIESDNEYETDTQRVSGVVPGIAVPKMHNKLYKQSTIMSTAIANVIAQAGFDALDSDYAGLVSGIKKTFTMKVNNVKPDSNGNVDLTSTIETIRDKANYVVSVNSVKPDKNRNVDISSVIRTIRDEKSYVFSVNNVKPDSNGNVDLTALLNEIKKALYPRVGDMIITKNAENPSVKYEGTTWELLEEKTFIMSAGTTAKVGEKGGSNTHTMSVAEMPKHSHTYTMGTAGGHDHTRGTMNITGKLGPDPQQRDDEGPFPGIVSGEGAFSVYSVYGNGSSGDSNYGAYGCDFDASKSWTGSTSYVAAHNHSLTINNTGSGSAWDSRPKYVAAYIWIRTK